MTKKHGSLNSFSLLSDVDNFQNDNLPLIGSKRLLFVCSKDWKHYSGWVKKFIKLQKKGNGGYYK